MSSDARIDSYLARLSPEHRALLQQLREDIARLAPDAVETISYGMPAFRLDGRFLVSFAAWKRHCSIYPIDDAILTRHEDRIGDHARTRGSLHFTAAKPVPPEVLADIVAARTAAVRGIDGTN